MLQCVAEEQVQCVAMCCGMLQRFSVCAVPPKVDVIGAVGGVRKIDMCCSVLQMSRCSVLIASRHRLLKITSLL